MISTVRIYFSLIGDFLSSVVLGFLCISFVVTGVVYPVSLHDKQLLSSLSIESYFPLLLLLLLLISLLTSIFISNKSLGNLLKKFNGKSELSISFYKTWFELGPLWITVAVLVFYVVQSILKWLIFSDLFIKSTVILNILLYPLTGYTIGQLVKPIKIFLWERRKSKRIFLDLNGKLLAK